MAGVQRPSGDGVGCCGRRRCGWAGGLRLFTNYSGLDPIVNGNSAAVGGSSGVGIDYGNVPMPRGVAFGIKMGY